MIAPADHDRAFLTEGNLLCAHDHRRASFKSPHVASGLNPVQIEAGICVVDRKVRAARCESGISSNGPVSPD